MDRQKAQKLVERLISNSMFITALHFYVRGLKPGEWTILKQPQRGRSRAIHWSWRYYLRAARRLLGIAWGNDAPLGSDSWLVPSNYRMVILGCTGLNLFDPVIHRDFDELPLSFLIHDPLADAFADKHPLVLERAKASLMQAYNISLPLPSVNQSRAGTHVLRHNQSNTDRATRDDMSTKYRYRYLDDMSAHMILHANENERPAE